MDSVETPDNDPTTAALGRAVAGQFHLDRVIGRGGMGIVYHALDEHLHREVAIKTLPPHLANDAHVRVRFLREARTAAGLSHPNIVPIYSAAEREGVVYFVMGFVNGESLAERIARDGPVPPRQLVALLLELADALGFAHAHGVVHRDVKAENVLLDRRTGRAMVTDFGIARVTETKPLTATGTVLGTVHYMSPEQVSGDAVDGRSDLYSLGVLAFFALTARFPFERSTASAVVVAHVNATPPHLSELWPDCPPVLAEIIGRLLAKSPNDRYASAGELRSALENAELPAAESREVRDVVIPGTDRSTPVRLSSTDAQQVWSRAAELQAHTGMITPPPTFTPRDNQPLVTRGYDVGIVKASAIDAGIDAKYVERAFLERATAAPLVIEPGEVMTKRPNIFLGALSKIELTTAFDGELDDTAFEEVAEEVRAALGEMVAVSAVGRTLTVTTGTTARQGSMPRYVQVHLSSRNGRTQLRVFEDLSQQVTGLFAGLGIGGGVSAALFVGAIVGNLTHSPPMVVAAVIGTVGAVLLAARTIFKNSAKKKSRELEAILRRLVERARQSMLARNAQRQLPR